MNELILIALILGTGYYLLIHQKSAVKPAPIIYTHSQFTQTETITKPINDNQDLEKTVDTLLRNIHQLNHSLK